MQKIDDDDGRKVNDDPKEDKEEDKERKEDKEEKEEKKEKKKVRRIKKRISSKKSEPHGTPTTMAGGSRGERVERLVAVVMDDGALTAESETRK